MSETIPVQITVQVEVLSEQMVRARALGPWRLQAIGSSWEEARLVLKRRLRKSIPDILPTNLFAGALPAQCDRWKTEVEIKPQGRSAEWTQAIEVSLQSFRWHLEDGQCVVRVPAAGCTLFGKSDELDDEEVTKQTQIALIRSVENQNLLALRQRFTSRSFDYQSMTVPIPIGRQQEKKARGKSERKKTAALRSTASDLTRARLDAVYGLDQKAADLAEHFIGENPQSILIVGPSGVGKTSLVHRMVTLRERLGLMPRKVWSTSGARIVSGMSGLGMWQQRCSQLIRQAHASGAIVHLGSLFELMEAGKIDGQPGVASMVRQAIARGKLLAIAECTPEQVAVIERDEPMLLRAFTRMEFKEPEALQVVEIIRAAASSDQGRPQVTFSDQAIEELYRLHARFATYSALPATPLRLMRSMREQSGDAKRVGADDVARAFAKQTGLPRFLVDDSVALDLTAIRERLASHVVGQTEPIDLIVDLIATLKARMVRPGRPLASLMFIGPTGVGKTEMAKAIARLLYSDPRRMIRIDMNEYSSPWSAVRLIGKPGDADGTLTSPIREQPFSVVLLDEFEKADPNVFDILLQLLGEGRLTDSQGRLADFRNAVVIMTSNLGAETFREGNVGFGDGENSNWREHFEREVRKFVRPEFLGRIDRIVPFQPLPRDVVRQIALRELDLLRSRTGLKYSDATLEFTPAAVELLSRLGYQPKYGARPLRRAIEQNVTVPLADELSGASNDSSWHFRVGATDGKITIDPEKRATKSKSTKETEAAVVNSWQQLGAMSRTARSCGPLRDLENELERNLRQNEVLQRRLQTSQGPRRIAAIREQLLEGQAAVETAKQLRAKLLEIVEKICDKQLELMTRWHRNQTIDWEASKADGKKLLSQLRQAAQDVVQKRVTKGNLVTLMVVGKGASQLEILWKAYHQLASANGWSLDGYLLQPYDPLLDPESPEYRKSISERKVREADETHPRPAMHLLAPVEASGGELHEDGYEKVCEVRRHCGSNNFESQPSSLIGFALQIHGDGVESWLENEHGVIHFFDTQAVGAKRRVRLRVHVFPGRLEAVELPGNWREPLAAPDRDPRRTFVVSAQQVTDNSGHSVSYAQGKQSSALVSVIQQEHERSLWHAIGYTGVPQLAQLHNSDVEIPF